MLAAANVTLRTGSRVVTVRSEAARIAAVGTDTAQQFTARVFIDCTYEGSLMKLAGVSYTFGREANSTYGEPSAGRLPAAGTAEAAGKLHNHSRSLSLSLSPSPSLSLSTCSLTE